MTVLNPTYASRVKETTTSTGTGTINLAGAVTGFQTFVSGIGDGNTCMYVIEAVDGNGVPSGDWEVGYGTVADASPDTLSRTTILESSNAGSAVNFAAGTKNVFCEQPTRGIMEVGCKVSKDYFSIPDSTPTVPSFDTESWDPFGMHEGVTSPSRVTIAIPGRYLMTALVLFSSESASGHRRIKILKNGADAFTNQMLRASGVDVSPVYTFITIQELAANDYVEVETYQNSGYGPGLSGWCHFTVQRINT